MSAIDKTLDERGQRYGEFASHAHVTQLLKRAMGRHPGWRKLADDQREALEMTAHKIGRILVDRAITTRLNLQRPRNQGVAHL